MGPLFINQSVRRRRSKSSSSCNTDGSAGDKNANVTLPNTSCSNHSGSNNVNGKVSCENVKGCISSEDDVALSASLRSDAADKRMATTTTTTLRKIPVNPGQFNCKVASPTTKSNENGKASRGDLMEKDVNDNQDIMCNKRTANSHNNAIRKYLVLLQDSLAIKFAPMKSPCAQLQTSQFPSGISGSSMNNGQNEELNLGEVDHPMHGLYLFKGFREANLKCYWNATLCEAIRQLDYKGYLVPSTILVFALPRFLTVLRTAWSRKMLRNPPGYRVDFVGEIEEIIAEPVPQGQFAPLSDSLCWAILELTSSGQEAFVDSILMQLATAFPLMSLPPRELVYQTLEKLIKDRKIYQTSHGYFVVTPDTFRYMNSGGDPLQSPQISTPTAPLDALVSSFYENDKSSQHSLDSASGNEDILILSSDSNRLGSLKRHHSLRVIRQRDLDLIMPSMGARSLSFRLAKGRSVFDSDKDERPSSRSNRSSTLDSPTEASSSGLGPTGSKPTAQPSSSGQPENTARAKEKSSKKPSFFQRWFSFRRSKAKKLSIPSSQQVEKPMPLEQMTRSPKIYSSIRPKQIQNNTTTSTQTNNSRSYEDILDFSEPISQHNNHRENHVNVGSISKWNSLPSAGPHRSRSRRSILNDSPFYDVITYNALKSVPKERYKVHTAVPSRNGTGYWSQTHSRRPTSVHTSNYYVTKSALAAEMDKNRRRSVPRIDSPCPSTTASAIYATIPANNQSKPNCSRFEDGKTTTTGKNPSPQMRYRRKSNSTRPWRPKSAFEILAHHQQHPQPSNGILHKRASMESLPQVSCLKGPIMQTISQNLKSTSTTSTELEVLLPMGKLLNGFTIHSPSTSNTTNELPDANKNQDGNCEVHLNEQYVETSSPCSKCRNAHAKGTFRTDNVDANVTLASSNKENQSPENIKVLRRCEMNTTTDFFPANMENLNTNLDVNLSVCNCNNSDVSR